MKIRYTPAARQDLLEMQQYITHDLNNPAAAKRVIDNILRNCSRLKDFPLMGTDLAAKTGRDTDLRFVVCGKQLAFYRVSEKYIHIIRILDGRTNYLQILFND